MSSCELSPSASAFSTMLSAFIGSVLNGLFSGFWIAFITGWISWLAVVRIVAAGLYEFYVTAKSGTNYQAVNDKQYESLGMSMYAHAGSRTAEQSTGNTTATNIRARGSKSLFKMFKEPERTVTVFGWLGWVWSAIYTPISQSIWLAVHVGTDDGAVQLVRALAIGVSALGLTFDFKQRYGAVLGRKLGSWAFILFNVWNATACLLLGVESAVLLISGAVHIDFTPIPILVIYPIFSIIWAVVSWKIIPPIDGARPGKNILLDILMGAFAGLFVAAPAFGLWQSRKFDADAASNGFFGEDAPSGLSLGDFLGCEGASVLEKFAAIMP
ncbi:hypothetical protein K491DRAFT_605990 [Lophiostoma macrostomum CBS 122681]|uniref:Uncharacterized protein n=1 Tax=Lophiostoma macrostomum CBS 122681 TaxID=1314788 RepID=A0A6A6SY20_9PLEO|nr:hypothetical protein K491DRAFT_605990 [Lophiostoma macrostomum CBS 122681]